MAKNPEKDACTPVSLRANGFNPKAQLPCGLKPAHIKRAMQDFLDFLAFLNAQLNTKGIERFESFLVPANFSSMVGEFMAAAAKCRKMGMDILSCTPEKLAEAMAHIIRG